MLEEIKRIRLIRQLKLGKIVYNLYYLPKGFIQRIAHEGLLNMAITFHSRLKMESSTHKLKPLIRNSQSETKILDIHFLSGKKFWYQTCFCAYSMAQNTSYIIRPIIYDDGTLTKKYQDEILKIFPNAKLIPQCEIEKLIENHLPESKYPYLRERRLNYVHIRKLTDIHVGSQGWKLVLDSDMLFFQTPNLLIDCLESRQHPCYMIDVDNSYGYSRSLMTSLVCGEIPELVNVGIFGFKSEDIDWDKVEYWCKIMIEQEGKSYYQEQAIVAMLMSGKECVVMPKSDYVLMPNRDEVIDPKSIMHHYVASSKPWYFRHGWKHIIK